MSQANEQQEQVDEVDNLMRDVARAVNDLPILARLEFAANLVLGNGGALHDFGRVPPLVVAYKVISDVIGIVKRHPEAAQLRTPEP